MKTVRVRFEIALLPFTPGGGVTSREFLGLSDFRYKQNRLLTTTVP